MVEYDFYAGMVSSARTFVYILDADGCMHALEWDFVAINAGYGDSGFFFNESGLQWDEYPGTFGGWLGGFFLPFRP